MTKATIPGGDLNDIPNECFIRVEDFEIPMTILPDISDGKSANYTNENSLGRTAPFTVFANGELRTVSWTCHWVIKKSEDPNQYLEYIRALQSAVYPTNQVGHPPPLCKIKCGKLLSNEELCCVLKNYSIKFDTSVPWDEETLLPYKLDIDLQFDVVYDQSNLPIASTILGDI
jgi:hypothetical protein